VEEFIVLIESKKNGAEFFRTYAKDYDEAHDKVVAWADEKYGNSYTFAIEYDDNIKEID
jgi:hypothetical protein